MLRVKLTNPPPICCCCSCLPVSLVSLSTAQFHLSFFLSHIPAGLLAGDVAMRISIPSIPTSASPRAPIEYTLQAATSLVSDVLTSSKGKALIMTGAGVSVDSGIAPYRGADGHYTVHKTYRPIFFHEFTDESSKGHQARQRYWSRSYLGYPPVCEWTKTKDKRDGERQALVLSVLLPSLYFFPSLQYGQSQTRLTTQLQHSSG